MSYNENIVRSIKDPANAAEGYNFVGGDDDNRGQIGTNMHSATLIGGGTENLPNWLGVEGTHPTHGATNYNSVGVAASHATILGTYDQVNNQLASISACPHANLPATTAGGHNLAIGGSWHKVDGAYNFCVGGGGADTQQNECTSTAVKSGILGGHLNVMEGDYSIILGGIENTLGTSVQYSTLQGSNGVSPFSYSHTISTTELAVNGDAQILNHLFATRISSTGESWIRLGGGNLLVRDIPIHEGVGVAFVFGGRITVKGVAASGTDEGKMALYTMDFLANYKGTQGSSSGWTVTWHDSSTAALSPAMTRVDTGANQLPMTDAPQLQAHGGGIWRIRIRQNTTDPVNWVARFDETFTAYST